MTDAPYASVERELAVLLRRARAWSRDLARAVHPELGTTAYSMLVRVSDTHGARASDLADHFGIDKSVVSRQVRQLETLGLLAREADPADARAQRLVLTVEGAARLEAAREGRRQALRALLRVWPTTDVAAFGALLMRYNALFEQGPTAES